MVRNYKREKDPGYSEGSLDKAIQEVKGGESTNKAAKDNNISYSTLHTWIKKPPSKFGGGHSTALSRNEEEDIVDIMIGLASFGRPVDAEELRVMTEGYLSSSGRRNAFGPVRGNNSSNEWIYHFRKWHQRDITTRKPKYISIPRVRGLTTDTLDGFSKILDELLTKLGIKDDPERIFNFDELGLGSEPRKKKMCFRRGVKNSLMITLMEGKSMLTVMFCGNANGRFLPSYVISKGRS